MRTTVLIPTYRRPDDLVRCLAAVRAQRRTADEVLVTVREDDDASRAVVAAAAREWPAVREVRVSQPGVVAAMNAGLDAATGDCIALTDDDTEPYPDWLERLVATIESAPDIAGAGGLDEQRGVTPSQADVGRLQWFGRVIGNHHVGIGPPRDVDVLKGACCAFRMAPLREIGFDTRLRGSGAQVHWELSLCLALRSAGWRLIYDPAIRVVHHVAHRHGDDKLHRGSFSVGAHVDAVFNETLVLARNLRGGRALAFRLWALLVGTRESPGVLLLPHTLGAEGWQGLVRWRATLGARGAALSADQRRITGGTRGGTA